MFTLSFDLLEIDNSRRFLSDSSTDLNSILFRLVYFFCNSVVDLAISCDQERRKKILWSWKLINNQCEFY